MTEGSTTPGTTQSPDGHTCRAGDLDRARLSTHGRWRRRGQLASGEVNPSWQVITFPPGTSRSAIHGYAEDALADLGVRYGDAVCYLRDLPGGMAQLRLRGLEASADLARAVYEQLRIIWPTVVR